MLSRRVESAGDTFLLIGDFNDIIDDSKKKGGNYRSVASRRDFCYLIIDNRLLNLGFIGYLYTWRNRREEGPIQQRLDRGLATNGWVNMYPEAKVLHEVLEGSDHAMLILDTVLRPFIRRRQFIYDSRWNKEEECQGIVRKNWGRGFMGSYAFKVVEKLKWVHRLLQGWRRTSGRNSRVRAEVLKAKLRQAYKSSHFVNEEVRRKENELKCLIKEE